MDEEAEHHGADELVSSSAAGAEGATNRGPCGRLACAACDASRRAWARYEHHLEERPLATKALTSFIGFAIGDVLAQVFVTPSPSGFDYYRLFRLASFGLLLHGPSSHWFYGLLDGLLPSTSSHIVILKVLIDQTIWTCCFSVLFFSYTGALEMRGLRHVWRKVRRETLTQMTGSWTVWPLAHTVNFRFVPSSQRVLFINCVQIGYNVFLSIIANRSRG